MTGRNSRFGMHAVSYGAVCLGLLVAVNWIANNHNKRWDLTEQHVYSLSPQSSSLITALPTQLKLVTFKGISEEDEKIKDLLQLYKDANPSKVAVDIIDPRAKPQLVEKYGMKSGNLVYLSLGEGELAAVSRINEATEE